MDTITFSFAHVCVSFYTVHWGQMLERTLSLKSDKQTVKPTRQVKLAGGKLRQSFQISYIVLTCRTTLRPWNNSFGNFAAAEELAWACSDLNSLTFATLALREGPRWSKCWIRIHVHCALYDSALLLMIFGTIRFGNLHWRLTSLCAESGRWPVGKESHAISYQRMIVWESWPKELLYLRLFCGSHALLLCQITYQSHKVPSQDQSHWRMQLTAFECKAFRSILPQEYQRLSTVAEPIIPKSLNLVNGEEESWSRKFDATYGILLSFIIILWCCHAMVGFSQVKDFGTWEVLI